MAEPVIEIYTVSRIPRKLVQRLPLRIQVFPRDTWDRDGYRIACPPYHPVEVALRSKWAAREASKRWTEAFASGQLDLDDVDFALAILDMVLALCVYTSVSDRPEFPMLTRRNQHMRVLRRVHGRYGNTTEAFVSAMQKFTLGAFKTVSVFRCSRSLTAGHAQDPCRLSRSPKPEAVHPRGCKRLRARCYGKSVDVRRGQCRAQAA